MIEKAMVTALAEEFLATQDKALEFHIADLKISRENDIVLTIDAFGYIDVDFCAALSRFLQEKLDLTGEDYSLEVGSVGLTDVFASLFQYRKNLGNDVETVTKTGVKYKGKLIEVNEEGFQIETLLPLPTEGKRPKKALQTLALRYEEVKYTRYDLQV